MKKYYGLTGTQKLILLMGTLDNADFCNDKVYIWGNLQIKEKVNFKRLSESINYFIRKNDGIRTRLCYKNNELMQYYFKYEEPIKFEIRDVNNDNDVKKLEKEIIEEPIEMINHELFILKMYRYPDGHGGAIMKVHHMISDGWSIGLAAHEIINYYSKKITHYITYSFVDYIKSLEKYESSSRFEVDKEFWEDLMKKGLPKLISIPSSMPKKDTYSIKSDKMTFNIDKKFIKDVKKYCKINQMSISTFFISIYSIFLRKATNKTKFMLASMSSNRKSFREKISFGFYANKIYFLIKVPDISFIEFTKKVNKSIITGKKHREYINRKQQELFDKFEIKQKFMANYLVSYQDMDLNTRDDRISYSLSGNNNVGTFGKDMVIHILNIESTNKFQIDYDYLSEKFTPEDIKNMNNGILEIAKQVLEKKNINISDIKIN